MIELVGTEKVITGTAIALQAIKALRDPHFVRTPGDCEMFVRQVFKSLYGVDMPIYSNFAGSALATLDNFKGSIYDIWQCVGEAGELPPLSLLQAGDLLFKDASTSGEFGHVGIVYHQPSTAGGSLFYVAENSSYHMIAGHEGNVSPAKGVRPLGLFAPSGLNMVVRLSEVP